MKTRTKQNTLDEKIVIDSQDVQRATELAVKRGKARISDIVVDGKVVDAEILQHLYEE